MNVRPAGRQACECASPINQILERLDQMDADIASAQQAANTAVGTATAQAGAAAASAASAQADAAAALINAGAAQQAADDAHDEAVAAAGSAQDAADDAADALLALQNIESTIASVLATDIGAKVDKLTTAGFHLYTHNGSTQGEVAPDINPTAATIPIRDSSGKLFGADPASGATDKTLVTANWVSQTGDSAPNNLIHRSGNETKEGNFTVSKQGVDAYPSGWHATVKAGSVGKYTLFAKFKTNGAGHFTVVDLVQASNTAIALARFMVHHYSLSSVDGYWIYRRAKGSNNPLTNDCMWIVSDGTYLYLAAYLPSTYGTLQAREYLHVNYGNLQDHSNGLEWLSGDDMIQYNDLSGFTNSWQVTE